MIDEIASAHLLAVIDELRPRIIATLAEAVQIPSINPEYPGQAYDEHVGQESAVARLVASVYEEAGATVDVFAVEEGRDNAVGVLGGNEGRSLLMNGHIDVVPAGRRDVWTSDPFSGEVADGRLWGRGSTDMKAGVIAQAFAALAISRAGVKLDGRLILTAVVGEETGDHRRGVTAVIERGYRADVAVVGEPSAPPHPLAIVPVTPGLLWFGVTVEGKATHDGLRGATIHPTRAGSRLGVNAIDKGFLVYQACERWKTSGPNTAATHSSSRATGASTRASCTARPSASTFPSSSQTRCDSNTASSFTRTTRPTRSSKRSQNASTTSLSSIPGCATTNRPLSGSSSGRHGRRRPDHPIIPALERAHERAAVGTPFHGTPPRHGYYGVCDATWLAAAGIPAIIYGPGDIAVAHAANESVDIEELITSCKTFALLAASWCTTD